MATLKDSAYNTPAALTITLASLAHSAAGVGRQSTIVDNTTTRFQRILLSVNIKAGTSPTAEGACYIYVIRSDNDSTAILDDGAGVSDAAITVRNAQLAGVLSTPNTTGYAMKGLFVIENPGPKWGVAVINGTGANLDSTGSNHVISYQGITTDIT